MAAFIQGSVSAGGFCSVLFTLVSMLSMLSLVSLASMLPLVSMLSLVSLVSRLSRLSLVSRLSLLCAVGGGLQRRPGFGSLFLF